LRELRDAGWRMKRIGAKFGVSEQRVFALLGSDGKRIREDVEDKKNYHCNRCNRDFYSHLLPNDVVCIKCGFSDSGKITHSD
jgi:ribosomal protein L37E